MSAASVFCACMRSLLSLTQRSAGAGGDRVRFRLVDGDGLAESRQLKDAPVVVAQAEREEALLLPVYTDEQCDEQPDAAAVHELQRAEVEDERARTGSRGFGVGVHESVLGKSGDFA